MFRLLVALSLVCNCKSGLVKVPRIYNALITSDENLSPSQAYPVLEPVLRTTALGVAFPPLLVQPTTIQLPQNEPLQQTNPSSPAADKTAEQQLTYHGSLYPLAQDSYIPYGYQQEILYPTLPFYQNPVFIDASGYGLASTKEEPAQAAQQITSQVPAATSPPALLPPPVPVVNFKKNPEIPDVLPPFPVRNDRKGKS